MQNIFVIFYHSIRNFQLKQPFELADAKYFEAHIAAFVYIDILLHIVMLRRSGHLLSTPYKLLLVIYEFSNMCSCLKWREGIFKSS
jgi:hypothetical protein